MDWSQIERWHKAGVAIVPVKYREKTPLVRWQAWQSSLPPEGQLRAWFRPEIIAQRNAAAICGHRGLTVLDFDDASSYRAWRAWTMRTGGTALAVATTTYRVRTSRGVHVYLFVAETPRCHKLGYTPDPTRPTERQDWGDIKGKGGYVLIAGSIHPSGAVYTALGSGEIATIDSLSEVLPEAPPKPTPAAAYPAVKLGSTASALMPQSIVEEIRERISILELAPEAKPSGVDGWHVGPCPYPQHGGDEHPSFWLNEKAGIGKCYKGCTEGHVVDVIALYAATHGLTNKGAIKELAARIRGV